MTRLSAIVASLLVAVSSAVFTDLAVAQPNGSAEPNSRFVLDAEDAIVVVGNTFAERLAMSGYLEALIHAAHPEHRITVRQVPWSADEAGFQPRELNVPTTEAYLREHEADVIIACFGMSESFAGRAGLEKFESDLRGQIEAWQAQTYNGVTPPRIVLVTPIRHEDLGVPWPTGMALRQHNADLAAYAEVMRRVAEATGARLVDLTSLDAASAPFPLTSNGIHPNETGCWWYARQMGRQLGWVGDEGAADPAAIEAADNLRWRAWDKHYHFRQLYRPTNTEYIWGRRAEPFGVVNFPPEQEQLRRMVDARQRDLWQMPKPTPEALFAKPPTGQPIWEIVPSSSTFPEDSWTPPAVKAEGTETSLGNTEILSPDQFARSFTLAPGFTIECFASEQDFPELANPLAMGFDEQHRLWVLCSPTYPHPLPGEMVHDRLIVLTDDDWDGKADRCETFAEGFGIATGFAIDTDGVYVAIAPDLLFFQDTNGDGKADRREVVLSGFGMPDSHHQISALEWAPDGGFMLHEGTFTRAGIETPFGTRRGWDSTIWYFEPRTRRLEIASHCGFPNPWGHAFDDYGASIMDATSGGSHYAMSHISTAFTFPRKPDKPGPVLNRGRPTAGNEIIASRHFPPEAHNSHLTTQSIGFHGLRWDRLEPGGSSWKATPMDQDLLQSSDTNFRPVAVEIGPDGALYVLDWCNPIIGHMQYSVRDPRRDKTHGRVWRVRHETRPLLTPPEIVEAPVNELLELLKLPERNTRAHARRRLQRGDPTVVLPAMQSWRNQLDPADADHDRLMLETLWISHGLGVVDQALLRRVLALPSPEVRAAAVRLARRWLRTGAISRADAAEVFEVAATDADMRVRLEAVVAAGFLENATALAIVEAAKALETDEPMRVVINETIEHLQQFADPNSAVAKQARLYRLDLEAFDAASWDKDKAVVALQRADVSDATRDRALQTLEADTSAKRASLLTDALLQARDPDLLSESIAPWLLGLVRSSDNIGAPDARLLMHPSRGVRALAVAWQLERGAPLGELLEADPDSTIMALGLRGDQKLTAEEEHSLQQAIVAGSVPVGAAMEVLASAGSDRQALMEWLGARIDAGLDLTLGSWTREHELALAALKALHAFSVTEWPERFRPLYVEADPSRLAAGREVYFDEAVGCVRCHGPNGTGLPGFPPLAGSAWVLGDPRRAATIVVHGMYGPMEIPGVGHFNSAMAPLGAVFNDQQIADVLTFVRQSWGNLAPAVEPARVAQVRRHFGSAGMIPQAATVLAMFPLESDPLFPAIGPADQGQSHDAAQSSGSSMTVLIVGVVAAVAIVGIVLIVMKKRG